MPARRSRPHPPAGPRPVLPPVPAVSSPSRTRRPRGRYHERQARGEGFPDAGRETVRARAADARSQASAYPRRNSLQRARCPPEPRQFPFGGVLRAAARDSHWVRRARAQDRSARHADRLSILAARVLRPGVRRALSRPWAAVEPRRARRLAHRTVREFPARRVASISVEYRLAPTQILLPAARGRFRRARREGQRAPCIGGEIRPIRPTGPVYTHGRSAQAR